MANIRLFSHGFLRIFDYFRRAESLSGWKKEAGAKCSRFIRILTVCEDVV